MFDLAVTLLDAVAARIVWPMLHHVNADVVALVAMVGARLADPVDCTGIAPVVVIDCI